MSGQRVTALLLGSLFLLVNCGGDESGREKPNGDPVQAVVVIELRYPLFEREQGDADTCAGALDYSGVRTGGAVTFKDARDTVVGTAELEVSEKSDDITCIWEAVSQLDSSSKFFTAEVGGWKSSPHEASSRAVTFNIDTADEKPGGGAKPRVDPSWTRTS
jgi:hypothetical protein